MTLTKKFANASLLPIGLLSIALVSGSVSAATHMEPKWGFQGKYILSVSDTDMLASAYVDGQLGVKEGTDKLSIIDLSAKPRDYSAVEVPASNSVAGPPAALSVDKAGKYAYIIETFTPRPTDNEKHTFANLKPGNILTVYDLKDKSKPALVAKHSIASRPDSVDISPDGQWLLITYHPGKAEQHKPLGLYKMNKGNIEESYFPAIPDWKGSDRLTFASWSPDGKVIGLVNSTKAEVSFYNFNPQSAAIEKWGNSVSVGKFPFIGRFSADSKHFLVNNLFWGTDVQGKWNEAPNGTIVNIALNSGTTKTGQPRHALSSQVMVGPSPEGFAISPSGDYVVTANMERSWLPYDDSRQSWYSSLTLIKRDPTTGAMSALHTTPYDSILPESVVFDATGSHLAVTSFDHYDHTMPGGAIDFFKIVADPLNSAEKMIMKTRWSVPVARGPHTIVLINE